MYASATRSTPRRRLVGAAALCALVAAPLAAPLAAQTPAPPAPDTGTHAPLLLPQDAWIGAGFVVAAVGLWPLDKRLAEDIQGRRPQTNQFLHHLATDVRLIAQPGSLLIGGTFYAVGRATKQRDLADLGLHGLEAIFVGGATSTVIKGLAGRARPYLDITNPRDFGFGRGFGGGDHSSFPSGHTTAAFAAAATVTSESRRWWPHQTWWVAPLMYGGATMVGVSRMYDNKHWASDVAVGAMIGTFAGLKVVRYHHHTNPNNRFDKWLLGARVVDDGAGGRALVLYVTPNPGEQR